MLRPVKHTANSTGSSIPKETCMIRPSVKFMLLWCCPGMHIMCTHVHGLRKETWHNGKMASDHRSLPLRGMLFAQFRHFISRPQNCARLQGFTVLWIHFMLTGCVMSRERFRLHRLPCGHSCTTTLWANLGFLSSWAPVHGLSDIRGLERYQHLWNPVMRWVLLLSILIGMAE